MLSFTDILITPYTELLHGGGPSLHRGGPHWPDFDQQTVARNCRVGVPCDDPPEPAREELTLDGPFAWGGPIVEHFGHQIGEFGMRLGPTVAVWPEAVFLHATHRKRPYRSFDRTPVYFQSMMEWFGIEPDHVRLIDRPTRVGQLLVAHQAEQLRGPGPSAAHLDWLDELTAARLGKIVKQGTVYVSKAAIPNRFAAEDYLEEILDRAGVTILRPETLPLQEQLRAYASARRLIFAEGSAMNGTQLLGRALGEVTVLRRKPGSNSVEHSLRPRAQSLRYVEVGRGLVHGVNRHGMPEPWIGITVLNDEVLVQELESMGIEARSRWSSEEYAARRDADVRRWLSARKESRVDEGNAASVESLDRTLRDAGLGHLTGLL